MCVSTHESEEHVESSDAQPERCSILSPLSSGSLCTWELLFDCERALADAFK